MKGKEFIKLYKDNPAVVRIADKIRPNEPNAVAIRGMAGSLDAVVAASVYSLNHQTHIFVLQDKEEAAYFQNDLQNLLTGKEILFFPTSYKRPYSFDQTENANILMRAEILNKINHKASSGELIVTYPEALTEKVINKRSLTKNTFTVKSGDQLDSEFLTELLISYDFEKVDFVYEAGQFAIRGGIIDIYSYAHELPYRLELFGDELESIRTFDPVTQLSQDSLKEINIIPNVQTRLVTEERQSFLSFIPQNSNLWFKDIELTMDVIQSYFESASQSFEKIKKDTYNTTVVLKPEDIFQEKKEFSELIAKFPMVEFGNRYYLKEAENIQFKASPQAAFNQNFDLIADSLLEYEQKGFGLYIAAESALQLERLENIFRELNEEIRFQSVHIGLRNGFVDEMAGIACYTDHELFGRFFRYKTQDRKSRSNAITLKELNALQAGDYVTHIDYGIGKFVGLEKKVVNGKEQEVIRLVYKDDDLLYLSIHALHKINKYTGKEGIPPQISKLGSPEWENKKKRVKKKVADIAKELIELYAKRKSASGYAYSRDGYLQAELESSFFYEDTPDQSTATAAVKEDMEAPHPMDRLVCGDVGFGKTEVAIRAAFKAATDGKQVAVLVPTTILAMQHHRTFTERLKHFPVKIEYINRFRSAKEIKDILKLTETGHVNILIGTHRIASKDVKFKNLGLMIVDEEQKFGVKVKDRLKEFKVDVDVLTLTATPIPRTLHFSLMGARDLSIIATAPPNRQPVTTEIHTFSDILLRDAISFELKRGGQVFFIHNRVKDIEEIANIVLHLVPDARIGIAHGQMDGKALEKVMVKFIEGEFDVLVSTNIVESGLDIPNANTIIINQAQNFGLSDLHQMRGRVGRSNRKAFCFLLTPPVIGLSSDARKRLKALEEFSDLGDGYKVALRDLDIRGAGNLLGAEQSGFITDLGFETYHKILDEAVQELKDTQFKDLFQTDLGKIAAIVATDCVIETDLEILIPDRYVTNISERLNLYTQLDNINGKEELDKFQLDLEDRFGKIPESVHALMDSVRLRWDAQYMGFEKLRLKNDTMRGFFLPADRAEYFNSSTFGNILKYVQKNPRKVRMTEHKGKPILDIQHVESIAEARRIFSEMKGEVIV